MNFVYSVYVFYYNLKYKMHELLVRPRLKRSFDGQVNILKKKKLLRNFMVTFSNISDISFTSFASGGVNRVLHMRYGCRLHSRRHFGEEDLKTSGCRFGEEELKTSGRRFGEKVKCVLGLGILGICFRRVGM